MYDGVRGVRLKADIPADANLARTMSKAASEMMRDAIEPLDLPALDRKWQERWARDETYKCDMEGQRPYYCLMMFPYPSAEKLHVGNARTFSGVDVFGRYRRMRGDDLFEPLGFDAFGIHSENFAIKQGEHPAVLTARNVEYFREKQLKRLGLGVDWSHEVDTTNPDYYKWTQWVFLQLFKAGLAEHREGPVKWCPSCLTVLADEQVISGHCERCDSVVEQKFLKQWFLKTTEYAQQLLDALDTLDWTEKTKTAQRNWIGRSEGAEIKFALTGCDRSDVTVFTTRPDTLYGATFLVIGADHPQLEEFAAEHRKPALQAWKSSLPPADAEPDFRFGTDLGSFAVHPLTGEHLPVWAAPYVLGAYGTGAIMAVPAHDQRDWQFAKAHRLKIVEVISGGDVSKEAYSGDGAMVNSGPLDAMTNAEGGKKIVASLEKHGLGKPMVQFRLRDWLISRQRYWGPPIPIIHCPVDGAVPVPEEDLPVVLPDVKEFRPLGKGQSPLAMVEEWVNVPCPKCGGPAKRETDVNDNFLDSAWYFLRYPSTEWDDRPFDRDRTWKWLPVDMYIGGHEHAVLHLMYARFIMRALFDLGHVPAPEPFERFRAHGLVVMGGGKISKSKGNVVNPDEYMDRYGADVLRLHLLFASPLPDDAEWNDEAIVGQVRFCERVWRGVHAATSDDVSDVEKERRRHRTIARVTSSIEDLAYNTAIAALHELARGLDEEAARGEGRKIDALTLVQLLAPLAPHVTEELWAHLGQNGSVHRSAWPVFDEALAAASEVTIAVQVNGKLRATFTCAAGTVESELEKLALAQEKVVELLGGGAPRKVIVVRDRIVNIVV